MIFSRNNKEETVDQGIPALSSVPALVDTSVIIDGRIGDISKAGFAPGKLLVPRFVLHELQNIADSSDAMRRGRGRRGLEVLNDMRSNGVDMEIIDNDFPEITEVDAKLVRLGRELSASVLTTDYNLNRVASIEGVRVLNINELANAVRPVILPGEKMMVRVVQPGKEKGQGVGYLADGTMIVVDNGDRLIGQDVPTEITRVFQTVAGKMLFAVPVEQKGMPKSAAKPGSKVAHKPANRSANETPQSAGHRQKASRDGDKKTSRPRHNNRQKPVVANEGDRRPRKRVSPTQRLENSLVELTKAED